MDFPPPPTIIKQNTEVGTHFDDEIEMDGSPPPPPMIIKQVTEVGTHNIEDERSGSGIMPMGAPLIFKQQTTRNPEDPYIILLSEIAYAVRTYYFGAQHNTDPSILEHIWHPKAHLYFLGEKQELMDWDQKTFSAVLEKMPANTNPDVLAYDEILSINVVSENTAMVKVRSALPPTLFTDFLSMLKIDGEWFIVSKISTSLNETEIPSTPLGVVPSGLGEIEDALLSYFRGGHSADVTILKKVFHSCASLKGIVDGKYSFRDSQTFFDQIASSTPDKSDETCKYDKIISIDKAGPNVACAKVQIGVPPFLYTDHLSLLRIEGLGWQIVSKTFFPQPFPVSSSTTTETTTATTTTATTTTATTTATTDN